ncbi:MAG: hypothetical protein KC486_15840 [Myxococcales bacterium]|nr:hypothetical protein [Myxococcales bacterium]
MALAGVLILGAACTGTPSTSATASATASETDTTGDSATSTTAATEATDATTDATSTTGVVNCEPPAEVGARGPCNPLDPSLCALPYPSNFYTTPDDSAASGLRLDLVVGTLESNKDGTEFDPTLLNEKDGFSILAPLLFQFESVSLDGVIGHENLDAYADAAAKTVILDAETGERIPHFVELDMTAPNDAERLMLIYPVTPLRHGARYVVGVRGLVKGDGQPVAVSPGFAALRDCAPTDDPDVLYQRGHYEEAVFPLLAADGFARGDLQLAWDFTTVSRESSLGQMEAIRDQVIDTVGDEGPKYSIQSVEDGDCNDPNQTIGRTIIVDMVAPLYTVEDGPDTLLSRGDDGLPYQTGDTTVEVMVRIPCSLINDPKPGLILQYGHGLFGSYGEAKGGYLSKMADDNGWVIIASDWTGMAGDDVGAVINMLAFEMSRFSILPERTMQGFAQKMAALRMVRGNFASDPAVTFGGVSVIDPDHFAYYGNSQGGILGGGYLAASPDLTRGVLGVGGTPYALLLPRSVDFDGYFYLLKDAYEDHRQIIVNLMAAQTLWDPGEAAGWAWAMNREPSPGIPKKDVLLQVAIGDAQVTTLGAQIQARAYGAATIAPQTRPVFGVAEKEAPFTGSGFVEWYYSDVPDEPVVNLPPKKDFDTHQCPRKEAAAQAQLRDFVVDGVINQHCDGKCEGLRSETCG